MTVTLKVDYQQGQSMPDGAIKGFAKGTLATSLGQPAPTVVTVGSELIVTAFRYYVKALDLGAGYVTLEYSNGVTDTLDADGMGTYVHPESSLTNDLLISMV